MPRRFQRRPVPERMNNEDCLHCWTLLLLLIVKVKECSLQFRNTDTRWRHDELGLVVEDVLTMLGGKLLLDIAGILNCC